MTWSDVDWTATEAVVGRIQDRIFRAAKTGDGARVKNLQKLLARSRSAKLLAIRQVTQRNAGRNNTRDRWRGVPDAGRPGDAAGERSGPHRIQAETGPAGLHPEGQRQAASSGHPDRHRPRDAGCRQTGAGTRMGDALRGEQ